LHRVGHSLASPGIRWRTAPSVSHTRPERDRPTRAASARSHPWPRRRTSIAFS
jgi:hypothetical protein